MRLERSRRYADRMPGDLYYSIILCSWKLCSMESDASLRGLFFTAAPVFADFELNLSVYAGYTATSQVPEEWRFYFSLSFFLVSKGMVMVMAMWRQSITTISAALWSLATRVVLNSSNTRMEQSEMKILGAFPHHDTTITGFWHWYPLEGLMQWTLPWEASNCGSES